MVLTIWAVKHKLIFKEGKTEATLFAEKRFYTVSKMPMTEAAINWGFTRDLYVALGEKIDDNSWALRLYYKPFIRWIWIGGLFYGIRWFALYV